MSFLNPKTNFLKVSREVTTGGLDLSLTAPSGFLRLEDTMLKNHNGQLLVRVGRESCVFTFMQMGKPEILDALDAMSELFKENRLTPFYRTGKETKEQVVVTKLDPGPDLGDLDMEVER